MGKPSASEPPPHGPAVDVTIRPETERDHEAIAGVISSAFGAPSGVGREAQLVAALRSAPSFVPALSLVAELEGQGQVVGHVLVSDAWVGPHRVGVLSPLSVVPAHQGRGIGSALVHAVVARADDRGLPMVVLEGDPAYYSRLGFASVAGYGVTMALPSWAAPEAAQLMALGAYRPEIRGRLRLPPAFALVEEAGGAGSGRVGPGHEGPRG